MKYNLRSIMHNAWKFFRKGVRDFSEALRMAWANAKAQNEAKAAAGITEQTHSWAGWKALGYEVIHGSTSLYKVTLTDPTTKKGTRVHSYFGASQVQPISA